MTYRNFEYRIMQSVDDPATWLWIVWIGDHIKQGAALGGREAALHGVRKLIDGLAAKAA
jgi:hypothetical protein